MHLLMVTIMIIPGTPSTYYLADGNLAVPQSCGGLPAYMII